VPDQKFIYILWQSQTFCARQKDDLHSAKLVFVPSQKFLEEALNAVKFLGWPKIFGPAQNILGPVKGQGISTLINVILFQKLFCPTVRRKKTVLNRDREFF
jgi:hypothetical protein